MAVDISKVQADIAEQRFQLDAWLDDAYAGIGNHRHFGEMDASFPKWGNIEELVGFVFDQRLLRRLSSTSMDSILFFISRNNECGVIIGWLDPFPGTVLSGCGDLTYDDFIFLCDATLVRPDDDCDYQLVACFQKLEGLSEDSLSRLNQFFGKTNSYTRRLVLHAFASFSLPQTIDLAMALWETDDCEFAKLSCLHSLKEFPQAHELFLAYLEQYKKLFDVTAEDYRRSHMEQLTEKPHEPTSENTGQ